MRIVIIGGTGLIGSMLCGRLEDQGHDPVAASPDTGVNAVTGEGLSEALIGAQVVVDVANAPAWDDAAVLEFFRTASRNLLAAEAAAGVAHHVALPVVGNDRLPRAKAAQERVVTAGTVPYTIVRATQFFEFIGRIANSAADGDVIRLSPALMRPIAADDVAAALADVATRAPVNGIVEIAGPNRCASTSWPGGSCRPTAQQVGRRRSSRPLLRNRARRQLARTPRRRAYRPHALDGLAAPVGSAEPVVVTAAQWTRPTSPNHWSLLGDPTRLRTAAAALRSSDAEQVFGVRFPGEYVMAGVARLLDAVTSRMDEHADLGHEVVSVATEIAEHVLNYVPPHRGQR